MDCFDENKIEEWRRYGLPLIRKREVLNFAYKCGVLRDNPLWRDKEEKLSVRADRIYDVM